MELKVILKEVLALHNKWIDTEGREGTRLSFRNAVLQEADLHDANLRNADFWMADLKDAILQGADLQGANLTAATNLTQTQIDSAITNSSTVLPSGLRHN